MALNGIHILEIDEVLHLTKDILRLQSKFIMWSVNHNEKLFEVECGGGHRTWDFHLHGNMAKFVYLKTRKVLLCEGSVRMEQPLVMVKMQIENVKWHVYMENILTSP